MALRMETGNLSANWAFIPSKRSADRIDTSILTTWEAGCRLNARLFPYGPSQSTAAHPRTRTYRGRHYVNCDRQASEASVPAATAWWQQANSDSRSVSLVWSIRELVRFRSSTGRALTAHVIVRSICGSSRLVDLGSYRSHCICCKVRGDSAPKFLELVDRHQASDCLTVAHYSYSVVPVPCPLRPTGLDLKSRFKLDLLSPLFSVRPAVVVSPFVLFCFVLFFIRSPSYCRFRNWLVVPAHCHFRHSVLVPAASITNASRSTVDAAAAAAVAAAATAWEYWLAKVSPMCAYY